MDPKALFKTIQRAAKATPGKGQDDDIPAMVDGTQPAALSHGEFVVPAQVVAALGDGNNEAGSKVLENVMAMILKKSGVKSGKQAEPIVGTPASPAFAKGGKVRKNRNKTDREKEIENFLSFLKGPQPFAPRESLSPEDGPMPKPYGLGEAEKLRGIKDADYDKINRLLKSLDPSFNKKFRQWHAKGGSVKRNKSMDGVLRTLGVLK